MTNLKQQFFADIPDYQWNDWKWQIENRITTLKMLKNYIDIPDEECSDIGNSIDIFKLAITPYYLSLINPESPGDPIKRIAVPSIHEMNFLNEDMRDPLAEDEDSPVPGLVHRYPDRVLLLATTECASYCRFCTRRRLVGTREILCLDKLNKAFAYIAENNNIRDVLISGGDPFTLEDDDLEYIIKRLRAIDHVEIIRIGTRIPVVMPQRVTPELVSMLRKYHPLWINTHFNHPAEITNESRKACEMIVDAGIPLGNQNVLLAGVNDCVHVMRKLVHELVKMRVRPYYMYQCDLSLGISHFRTSVSKGIEIMEGLRGHTSGFCVPTFVIDAPNGGGKIPLIPNYTISEGYNKVVLRNYEGKIYCYDEPENYTPSCSCDTCAGDCDASLEGVCAMLQGRVHEKNCRSGEK